MNCKITQSKMIDYIDDALYHDEACAIDIHLCECDACRAECQALKAFSDTSAEFIVYPATPYTFATLRARMASIRPLDEVMAFLPKMRARGLTARLAMAVLLLVFTIALPLSMRGSRETLAAARSPFVNEKEKWEDDYQQELDDQYRRQMVAHQRSISRASTSDVG